MKSKNLCSRRKFVADSLKLGAGVFAASSLASAAATAQETNSPWRIGCYTRPWDKYDYRQALDAIAEAGFKYAGLMTTNSDTHLVISVNTTPDEALKVGEECKQRGLGVPAAAAA